MRLQPMAEGDLAAVLVACDAAALATYPADAVYMARRL
jgi:hypothetical protein